MREEETLTWSAGGDGDDGEALAGQPCFLSSVPSSTFLFLLSFCVWISLLCLLCVYFLFSVSVPLRVYVLVLGVTSSLEAGKRRRDGGWSASCFLPPLLVAFLRGLLCFFEKKQGNNKSTLFFSSSLLRLPPRRFTPLSFYKARTYGNGRLQWVSVAADGWNTSAFNGRAVAKEEDGEQSLKTTPFSSSKGCFQFGPWNSYNFAIKPLVKM